MNIVKNILAKLGLTGTATSSQDKLFDYLPTNAVGLEIGVWKGDFSAKVIKKNNPKKYHLLDPWKFQPEFKKRIFGGSVAQSQDDMDAIFEGVKKRFKNYPNVSYHRGFSDERVIDFVENYFDWIYIDGNHYYDYIMNDLKNYFPKVKVGGFISGDDYYWSPKDLNGDQPVKRAVEKFLLDYEGRIKYVKLINDQFILQKLTD